MNMDNTTFFSGMFSAFVATTNACTFTTRTIPFTTITTHLTISCIENKLKSKFIH